MTRSLYFYFALLLCSVSMSYAQKITVNNPGSLEDLILNNLINGCVEVSNITSSVNGSNTGILSYGEFNQGSSNFPFENGIMLSTGNALSAGNSSITTTLSDGSTAWGSDPDLEAALGVSNTINATSIEFDIISTSNQLQFNYLLASEEYEGINSCQFSDGFAFLIRPTASAAQYENIAVIPNTSIPVNTGTIHPLLAPNCPAVNEQYFDDFDIGDTNYKGRTTVLTASTTIIPYVQYHIKLVIADQSDQTFDSAVFIEGDSFDILDLGEDIATCASSVVLDADIQNQSATYNWFLDDIEIIGETNSTLNAIQSGTYKVEVTVPLGTGNCVEEDEIIVVLDTEENINPISNYELCDDLSGDGVEFFDLSNKDMDIANNNLPFTNYIFSYHLTDSDARNNQNGINAPIQNTSNPQTIYVRIEESGTGCLGFTTFNLIVNPVPNITDPTPLDACDGDSTPDGYTIIDLTEKDNEITGGQSNLIVTYHYSTLDADSGNNAITTYTNNSTPSDMVYVRVYNIQTGCYDTTTLDININVSPIVNTETQQIDACDSDLDGFATFDLTEVLGDILGGLTGVTTSFHETFNDAESGTNPIANPSNYANIQPNVQTVYVRVEDNTTGCSTIVPIEIHTNLLLTGTAVEDYAICDAEGSGGSIAFNLNIVEDYIANDIPNVTVTFYDNEADRLNAINPIPKNIGYPVSNTSPKTVYLRISDGVCEEVANIRLIVNPILLFNPADPLRYCDNDDDVTDGTISVDLSSFDEIVTNGNTDFTPSYFPTQTDAENNFNQLPLFHTVSGTETIYVRIENINTGCATVSNFDIQIIQAPDTETLDPIIICDTDQDGFSIIDLNAISNEAVSNPSLFNINFFTSFDDAEANTNTIPVADRTSYNATTQTIYVRVENAECYKIEPIDIIINTLPIIPDIEIMQICEDDNDGIETFLFSDKDDEILNGQLNKVVYYFENQTDAENGIIANAIDKNAPYTNTSSPQTIHVRVENITGTNCFATDSFTIRVSSNPVYNTAFENYFICDDESNDERHTFDLSDKIAEIRQGSPNPNNLDVTFHLTSNEAQIGSNPLPLQYTNATNPQNLFVRIQAIDTQCVVIDNLSINIIPLPNLTEANPLVVCDTHLDRFDGVTAFNLDNADYQNLDRIQTIAVHYFENFDDINQDDALDNSLAINNPTNYISDSKTVYIKVTNTITECFSVIPLDLVVESPPAFNTVGTIEICDNDTDTFDLLQVNGMLLDNPSSANFSYHNSLADAETNATPIGNTFNYTSTNHTIYVRLTNINSSCYITTNFNLQINPNPIANTPPDLVECDDDYDGFFEFDLSQNNNDVLGAQNPTIYSVTYYTDLTNAEAGTNAVNNSHPANNGDIIYARLENNNTGCYDISQFTVFVNPLPIIPVNDVIPLCVNDLPLIIDAETGNPNDTYLWSTGETTPQIELGLGDAGDDYWVTVTRPYANAPTCEFTKPFSVIESAIADINFTATVDFADPNSITVDVSGIGDYIYILDNGEPQESNVFENVTLGNHIVTVRDLNGCADVSQEVTVFDIPKFVTPNNDGYFDRWHVVDFTQLPGTVVYIHDRYGKLLKTLPHTSQGWDGTYNGYNMPADDYWFVANIVQQGNAFTIKGHFALKR